MINTIQKRVYEILSAGLDQPVYDYVPPDAALPYCEVGDDLVTDLSDKTNDLRAVLLTVHCWSAARGRKEVREMAEAVRDLLHDVDLGLDGVTAICRAVQSQTFRDPDGMTHHGTVEFRILV